MLPGFNAFRAGSFRPAHDDLQDNTTLKEHIFYVTLRSPDVKTKIERRRTEEAAVMQDRLD